MNQYRRFRFTLRNWATGLTPGIADFFEWYYVATRELPRLRRNGFAPPLHGWFKRAIIRRVAQNFGAKVLVETGTYQGDTPWAFRNDFTEIHTIEVQPQLAELARRRFKRHAHVHVVAGDSAECLAGIVHELQAPTLFWLDGHYSGFVTGRGKEDCPVMDELAAIFHLMRAPFVILIDDARCFGSDPAYPTLENICAHLCRQRSDYAVSVENDIIFFLPKIKAAAG